jgi:hypothetical protein
VGAIVGSVYDGATGDTVAGVVIEIDGDPTKRTVTDLNGFFRFDLPPGTYRLKLAAQNYFETAIDSVVVASGNIVEASTVMSNTASGTTVDVVESGTAAQATAQAMLIERKLSPVVSDSISKEELRESVASDAAGALEKVTGVSVVDDGFVYVRGLGERYSATMLNNAMMPTTDPEKRVVPLDMFPSSLIDSIKVLKTYTPDLPGEFSGGLVQMQTVEFPTARTLSVGVSSGFNTNTSFKPFDTYSGGNRDYFGFDDGARNIPSLIPEGSRLFPGRFTQAEMVSFGRAFPVNYEPQRIDSMRPGQGFSISGGDTIKRLGLVGALTFNNSPSRRTELQRYLVNVGGGRAEVYTEYRQARGSP